MTEATINVTADCITRGDPLDCHADAIALAAREIWPHATRITTGYMTLFVAHGAAQSRYPLPGDVQRFVEQCRLAGAIGRKPDADPFTFTVTEMGAS